MEEIKNYIFYTILKDFSGNKLKDTGIAYGIEACNSIINHEDYFRAFLNIDYFPWEGLELSSDWSTSLEVMSADGNVMIANAAPEVKDLKERTYVIYLPSEPNLFQILFLERISIELSESYLDVGIYGSLREKFLEKRMSNDFDSHLFLKQYISYHKEQLEKTKLTMRKVLP